MKLNGMMLMTVIQLSQHQCVQGLILARDTLQHTQKKSITHFPRSFYNVNIGPSSGISG